MVHLAELGEFGQRVSKQLWQAIQREHELPDTPPVVTLADTDPLDAVPTMPKEMRARCMDGVRLSRRLAFLGHGVRSGRIERYEGKDTRVIPRFPELRPLLEALFNERAKELGRPPSSGDHIIKRYRVKGMNLRTQLERIIKRAGLKAWPKLWQNLRASRATELAAEYPAHVAAAWLGHSTLVAQKHYWQVTDADFERAAKTPSGKTTAEIAADGVVFLRSGSTEAQHENATPPKNTAKA